MTRIAIVIALFLISFELLAQPENRRKSKKTLYEEVDVEDLMKRYFAKSLGHSIEGIYSVSCVITKRNKRFLSRGERIRIVAREDNYAKVAIMKDWPASDRGFIEVSLSYRKSNSFPIMGELDAMAGGGGFIYTHIEPDGERLSFSMLEADGLLEAEYSKSERRSIITYRLSYMKIYPARDGELTVYESGGTR